jgi:hypothetical protein
VYAVAFVWWVFRIIHVTPSHELWGHLRLWNFKIVLLERVYFVLKLSVVLKNIDG